MYCTYIYTLIYRYGLIYIHSTYTYIVLQCVAVGCIVLQCVAVCCSVLQCVAKRSMM